jgi:MauM/NapG family ferredoxin protein
MNPKITQRIRIFSQIVFFCLFMVLFVQAVYLGESALPSDFFYRIDPLIAATAMLAGRVVIAGLLYSIITIFSTLVFGRVWCGWICPMGSVLDWIAPSRSHKEVPDVWRRVKHLVFLGLIIAALLRNQTAVFLDPITILTRTMTTVIWPGLRLLIQGLEGFLYQFDFLWPVLDSIHQKFYVPLFQGIESVFFAALPVFLFFTAIAGFNHIAERFWCRYICPLGGFLGLTSRFSIFRRSVNENCIDCNKCSAVCPTGTVNAQKNYASDPAECTMCFNCAAVCPADAIHFPANLPGWNSANSQSYDPQRRQVLQTAAGVLAGVALAGLEPTQRWQPSRLIRPPGAMLTEFEEKCMRCGECVRVCPTQGLQPSLLESGWPNLFTPRLMPRLGYCSYNCDACLRTCPTGAIPPISKEQKQEVKIGLASINTDRCLPWAYDTLCSVCEEMCPLPEKAISLEEVQISAVDKSERIIFRPKVNRGLCIGCGVCEYHCPVGGDAAIQVLPLPEIEGFITGI